MKIIITESPAELAHKGAGLFRKIAVKSVSKRGHFAVAVSGGSTPRAMHSLLARQPFLSEVPWDKTHIFWVDDRCVPYDNPASNFGAAKSDLLNKVPIPKDHVHPVPVDIAPLKGAVKYQNELLDYFNPPKGDIPVFDLIVLGIGTDGHTASLFPGYKELEEEQKLIVSVEGGKPFVHRLTMTLPIINGAREIVFLVSGRGKADISREIFHKEDKRLPAQLIKPVHGNVTLLIDRDAALLLDSGIRK